MQLGNFQAVGVSTRMQMTFVQCREYGLTVHGLVVRQLPSAACSCLVNVSFLYSHLCSVHFRACSRAWCSEFMPYSSEQ